MENNVHTIHVKTSGWFPNLYNDLEFWMSNLPEKLKTLPIIYLAIPGSHDSMSYTIQPDNDIGPDESLYITILGRYCAFAVKPIIFNWSITQNIPTVQQLNGGIRYFDLRVATKPMTNEFYFLHGLYGAKINAPLKEIANWLDHHPNEINKLCPVYESFDHITLEWLFALKYQIFLIYRNINAKHYVNLWPSNHWPTPWPNTTQVSSLINILNNYLKTKETNMGFISQCLLTPNFSYVIRHICGNLRKDLVSPSQKAIISWINETCPGRFGYNVVIADFISDNNFLFCKSVIASNAKLL